jgi:hypothetical protein
MTTNHHNADVTARRLAVVVRDVLGRERFTTLADVIAAVKYRCAVLRIPWTNDTLAIALDLVGSNHRGLQFGNGVGMAPKRAGSGLGPGPALADPSRAEAVAMIERLLRGCA